MTVENDDELKLILSSIRTVASVGVSSNREKASYWVFHYLVEHGYDMIPVNPSAPDVLGLKAYPDLASVPRPIEVVQVFRRPEDVPPVVAQAIDLGAKIVWMQKGIFHAAAAEAAEAAGLRVVMDRCMMETHQRLMPASHR